MLSPRFFECNVQFGNKICLAVAVNGFVYIGPNARSGAKKLLCDRGIFFRFAKRFIEQYDLRCKVKGFIQQRAVHGLHLG